VAPDPLTTRPAWPTRPLELGGACLEVLATTSNRWLFDRRRRRYLQLSNLTDLGPELFELPWSPYETVEPTHDGRGLIVTRPGPRGYSIYVFAD
jgi:hypothetical protein